MALLGTALLSTLIIFSLSVFYFFIRAESAAWRGRQSEAARNAAGTVSSFIERVRDSLFVLSVVEPDYLVSDISELDALLKENEALLEIVRVDPSGNVFANTYRDKGVLANLITIPQSQWFLQAREGQIYLSNLQLSATGEPYIILSIPTSQRGVAVARVSMNILWDVVKNIRFGKSGEIIVISREGDVVAHTYRDFAITGETLGGRSELFAILNAPNNEWSGAYTNFQGKRVVGTSAPVSGTDWIVITELPQSEAYASSSTAVFVLGVEAIILLVMVNFIVARFVRRLIVRPMEELQNWAEEIGVGNFNQHIDLTRKDEVGKLATAFNIMADQLQNREIKLEEQRTALQVSEARYRAIVEDQTELVCRFLPDGTLTFVNDAYCRYFKKEREDLIGHSFIPLIPEEDRKYVGKQFATLSPSNPVVTYEHRVIMPDESIHWQQWTDRALLNAEGQVTEYASVGRDITAQKLAQLALQESEINLRRITDNMYDVITQIGPDGSILFASPSHKWVLGIEPGDVIGTKIFERLHPDDVVEALTLFSQALEKETRPDPFALRYQHAQGHYLWMECSSSILKDDQGQFNGAVLSSREITQRKEVEAALRKSEQRYRLLAENASDVIWTLDLDLNITYISPAVQKLRGYTPEEALSQSANDILTPKSLELAAKIFTEIISLTATMPPQELRREYRTLELEMRHRDGSTVWVEIRLAFLLDEQDKPIGIVGVTRDITERREAAENLRLLNAELENRVRERTADLMNEIADRKQIEKALRDSEARYRAVMQQSLEAIYIFDAETFQVLETNPTFLTLLGYKEEEITHLTLYDIVMEEKSSVDYFHQRVMSGEGIKIGERVWRRKDDTTVEVEVTANRIQQGGRNMVFVVARDITKRKRAEMALRESEERYALAVRGANDGLWDWNLKTNEIYFSPRWSNMLGLKEFEIGSTPEEWFKRVHSQDLPHLKAAIDLHINRDNPHFECEFRIQHSNKDYLWVLSRGLAVYDASGRAYRMAGSQTDITDRKRAEEQVRASLQEKEVLLKEIHHRVKNNLQIISSLLHLQAHQITDARTLQALGDSQSRVRSMALIHEKLYQSQSLADIDFGEYVKSLAADLFRSYQHNFSGIQLDIQVDEINLDLDHAVSCGLILNELLTNSLKYAFPNGRDGTISVELHATPERLISLRVADNGVGIPTDFDLHHARSLGLQLVNNLVMQLDAKLEMERSAGTVFQISFEY